MADRYELNELYKNKQYEEIIGIWNDENEVLAFDEGHYVPVMNSFYALKRYADCLEVYRAFHRRFPDSSRLDDRMGWSLYYNGIKNYDLKNGDPTELRRRVDFILEHCADTRYSPLWFMTRYLIDAMEKGTAGFERDYRVIEHCLDRIDPAGLSAEEQSFMQADGKTVRLASDMETWYSEKSKVLLKLEKFDACAECCDTALRTLNVFHYNNDGWFRYRKAKCLQAQGRTDEARALIGQVLKNGLNHWSLQQMMFELERADGNTEQALQYAGACALADREHKMRVNFYAEFADFLETAGRPEEAMLHRRLAAALREENGWSVKNGQNGRQLTPEIAAMDAAAVQKKLQPFWRELRDRDKVFLTGRVDNILPEGKSGFIRADGNGTMYYFRMSDVENRKKPAAGAKVRFVPTERLDPKKNKMKPNAVQISVL